MSKHLTLASAYRQLSPAEKIYVDAYVAEVEKAAHRAGELISVALERPIPASIIERSGGMLDRVVVQLAIRERITQIASETEVTPRRIVKELCNIAFSNIMDYMRIDPFSGRPTYDLSACTPEQTSAVKKVEHKVTALGAEEMKFELYSKEKALDQLCRIFGMYQDENPVVMELQRMQQAARSHIDKTENAGEAYAKAIS